MLQWIFIQWRIILDRNYLSPPDQLFRVISYFVSPALNGCANVRCVMLQWRYTCLLTLALPHWWQMTHVILTLKAQGAHGKHIRRLPVDWRVTCGHIIIITPVRKTMWSYKLQNVHFWGYSLLYTKKNASYITLHVYRRPIYAGLCMTHFLIFIVIDA